MNRYIAFLKAFERNSFSDAARDLGYTQSAVSQMIKSLEAELGVTLLVRSRSGVTLTYEGRHLLPYIRDTVNAYRMLQSQAAGFSGLEQGTIRLGTFTSVSSFLLPPAMERFRRQHSRIRFELYQGLYYEIEDWVRDGVVDFGFTDMLRTTPFPCEPIYQDTMLAVLPEGHHPRRAQRRRGAQLFPQRRSVSPQAAVQQQHIPAFHFQQGRGLKPVLRYAHVPVLVHPVQPKPYLQRFLFLQNGDQQPQDGFPLLFFRPKDHSKGGSVPRLRFPASKFRFVCRRPGYFPKNSAA